eukprot:g17205.t1
MFGNRSQRDAIGFMRLGNGAVSMQLLRKHGLSLVSKSFEKKKQLMAPPPPFSLQSGRAAAGVQYCNQNGRSQNSILLFNECHLLLKLE